MQLALKAALKGRFSTSPNPRVGCVFVQNGEVVSAGWHMRRGGPHAEVAAVNQARERGVSLKHSTCYVTLEPCSHFGTTPPCADTLVEVGVARVVAACEDPNPLVSGQGFNRLKAAGVDVTVGVLESEARALNPGFFSRMQRQRPFVRVKIAASLDGRTALSNGRSKWITQAAAREDVHRLRALSSAIITGAGTIRADDPQLTVRSEFVLERSDGKVRQPLRVVLAGKQAMAVDAEIFHTAEAPTLLVTTPDVRHLEALSSEVCLAEVASVDDRLDLSALLKMLALDHNCNEVLIEAGPTLASRFLAEGLCDELWWYTGAMLLGADAKAAIDPLGYHAMTEVDRFHVRDLTRVGDDTRTILNYGSAKACSTAAPDLQTDLYHWITED